MGRIEVRLDPYDEEGVLHLLVYASSFGFSGGAEIYTTAKELADFGSELTRFPADLQHKVTFTYGDGTQQCPYYLVLQAQVIDRSGHCALLVHIDSFVGIPENASAQFYIPAEAVAINSLGESLSNWARSPEEPFEWSTEPNQAL